MEETFEEFEDRLNRMMNSTTGPTLADCDAFIKEGEAFILAALEVGLPEDAPEGLKAAAIEVVTTVALGVVFFKNRRDSIINDNIARMEEGL